MERSGSERTEGGSFSETVRLAVLGRASALGRLFGALVPSLTTWAHGRLPLWARARVDTDDLVQDAVMGVLGRLPRIEARRRRTIRAYLRRAIRNQITDEIRRAGKVEVSGVESLEGASHEPSPFSRTVAAEQQRRYRRALLRLSDDNQELIVGRLDLAYSYEQLALATGRSSPDAARVAVRRALLRLAQEMAN